MIITKSNISMNSKRDYSSLTKQAVKKDNNGLVSFTGKEQSSSSSQEFFKDIMEGRKKNDEASQFTKLKAKFQEGDMGLKKNYEIKTPESKEEKLSAKRVREMTLIYLLIRIRNSLYKQGSTEEIGNAINEYSAPSSDMAYYSTEKYSSFEEQETTSFETTGQVVTKDGRTIDFNVCMKMTRSFMEETYGKTVNTYQLPNLVDPLVINLDNNVASVSDQEFTFDIDSDGVLDSVKALGKGSGYLSIDLNGDGIINDGSELFGTKSGNGFDDLKKYDLDGNGFIDEADEVFDKLLIWTKDEDGNDVLYHLKDKGVGAICLESTPTEFSLNDLRTNKTNAIIRQTGFFLYEDARVGTLQQLDLAT